MIHLTPELEAAILRSERAGIRCAIATVQRLYPEIGAAYLEIAGGIISYTGPKSPLSEAYGVGADVPISDDDIARITEFYGARGVKARIYASPLSHPTLTTALTAAGYTPLEYVNVLASNDFEPSAKRDDRIVPSSDFAAWADASTQAFSHDGDERSADTRIATILVQSDGVLAFEARVDGAIAATAAMDLRDGCATFFAGSTVAAFRGRGLHTALVRERIARARDGGAQFMRATALPGSTSERNFRRSGFVTLYTRTLWQRAR